MKKIFDRLFRIGIIIFLGVFTSESSLHVNESKSQLKTTQIENLRMKSNSLNTIKFKKIECGFHHCLALDENDRLWAWGANGSGQIGNGTFDSASHPIQIMPQKKLKTLLQPIIIVGHLTMQGMAIFGEEEQMCHLYKMENILLLAEQQVGIKIKYS